MKYTDSLEQHREVCATNSQGKLCLLVSSLCYTAGDKGVCIMGSTSSNSLLNGVMNFLTKAAIPLLTEGAMAEFSEDDLSGGVTKYWTDSTRCFVCFYVLRKHFLLLAQILLHLRHIFQSRLHNVKSIRTQF